MNIFTILVLVLFAYSNLWFLISLIKKRNDVADVAWGLGFVLMAWVSFILSEEQSTRGFLVGILVSIWGLRLAWYIHKRNKKKKEDYRYFAWRQEWGKWVYLRSYFQVYLLQGFFLFIIFTPVLLVHRSHKIGIGLLDILGIGVWFFGFCFEAIGDIQLAKFIQNPVNKGRLMQGGLWGYTRHPNYFGEAVQWWGLWLIALSVPNGALGIIGPITITFLLLKVSGIPMLEKKMSLNPDFIEYKKRVSVFIPMFPKR